MDRTIRTFDPAQIARLRAFGDPSALPVLVVGMPRSGTTLIEQIIASHPLASGGGELRFFPALAAGLPDLGGTAAPYPEGCAELDAAAAARICAQYLALLRRHSGTAVRVTDKLPGNFLHLGLACALFPNGRVINCRRAPADVCLSIYFQNFAEQHDYAWDLEDIAHFHGQYERLMAHWRAVLPGQILDVRYEDTVADLPATARLLLAHCGLDWDPRCLEFHRTARDVRTASNTQVRQPIYTQSVRRWERYARFLPPSVLDLNARYS